MNKRTALLTATCLFALATHEGRAQDSNLIKNPGFEKGKQGWKLKDKGSSLVRSPTHAGSGALKLINDFTGKKAPSHDTVQRVKGIKAGTEYLYSVWVRGEDVQGIGAGGKPMAMLSWLDRRGKKIGRWLNLHAPYKTYDWRQMVCHCEAPPKATQCDVYIRSWWDCTGGLTYWDDFVLQKRDLSDRGKLLATFQAESADTRQGCTISSKKPGYSGKGYVTTAGKTAYVEWKNVSAGAGNHILVIRYSQEAGRRKWSMLVNGKEQGKQKPIPTSSPEGWATIAWTAKLKPGNNTVRLLFAKGIVGPWIDRLDVYAPAR